MEHTGAAASLIIGDKVIWSGVHGRLHDEKSRLVTEDTLFMIASISKIITGVAVLQLYEQNLLSLDEDINTYISVKVTHPYYPDVPITPRFLLQHRSGLNDSENGLVKWRVLNEDSPVTLEQQVRNHLTSSGQYFQKSQWSTSQPPGKATYHYSNAGFTLLGYLVEQVSKIPFPEYTQKCIFEKIGITSASWFLLGLNQDNIAVPHQRGKPFGHYGIPEFPAGQLRISLKELTQFFIFFTNGSVNGVELLKPDTVQEMLPRDFCNGLAWWGRDTWYGDKSGGVWTHGGYMTGIRTHVYFFPREKSIILILTNDELPYDSIYKEIYDHMNSVLFSLK